MGCCETSFLRPKLVRLIVYELKGSQRQTCAVSPCVFLLVASYYQLLLSYIFFYLKGMCFRDLPVG